MKERQVSTTRQALTSLAGMVQVGFVALSSCAVGACAPDGSLSPQLAFTQTKLSLDNGLQVNGIRNNGAYVNGLSLNSMSPNGITANGLPLNGLPLNGLYVNGLSLNGIGSNGLPLNGLPLNGLYVNGLPLNGLPLNGLPLNGYYSNGLPLNGIFVNGLPLNGLGLNGLPLNGLFINGMFGNGLPLNGLAVNGLPLNGLPLNGLRVNGTTAATAIKVSNGAGGFTNLTAAQEGEFQSVMKHLVRCALANGDSLTIYNSAGTAVAYPGYHNLAPAWKSTAGGLGARDPNAIDAEEKIRWCVEHYRKVDANNAVYPGLALNAEQITQLKTLLKYAAECALSPVQSVVVGFPTASGTEYVTYFGALGLAQSWATGSIDLAGQKAVSACLGARTNALGVTVRISLRGPYTFLGTTTVEKKQFGHHEGAFWGNLFGSAPALKTCAVDGGGPSGRMCTDGSCGFVDKGACATAGCTKDADGNWSNCESGAVVLNTFLMMENTEAAGGPHTCARRSTDDAIWCWGDNARGELGDNTLVSRTSAAAVAFPSFTSPPKQLSAGYAANCTRLRDGTLWCWGANTDGQLGNGTFTDKKLPVQVTALGGATAKVVQGEAHTCAVKMDGSLWCWGDNLVGQVGDGTTTDRANPVQITALGNSVIDVSAGYYHTCALKMDGTMWCWGDNYHGQLGDGTQVNRRSPVQAVEGLWDQVTDIALGNFHSCALKTDGTAWCWGENDNGQVGDGTSSDKWLPAITAIYTTATNQVVELAAGNFHTCLIKTDRTVWCWGYNFYGQVGNGTLNDGFAPAQVTLPAGAREIAVRGDSTFAALTNGDVYAWGDNQYGQLGDTSKVNRLLAVKRTVLSNAAMNETESNNTSAAANNIATSGTKVTAKVSSTTDLDWFKLSLPAGKTLSVDLVVPSGKNYDVWVYVGGVLKGSGYSGAGLAERVTFKNTTTGAQAITIKVAGVSSAYSTTASYYLTSTWW